MKKSLYMSAVYIYLYIPFICWALGWLKPIWAIPILLLSIICLYRMIAGTEKYEGITWNRNDIQKLFICIIIIVFLVLASGIGGYAAQSGDNKWRNGMFETLVNYKWPVIADVHYIDGATETRAFSYYIGFWIVPALIGKVFGMNWAYFFQVVWAVIGMLLFYVGICVIRKRINIWPLFVFFAFGGMQMIAYMVFGVDSGRFAMPMGAPRNSTALNFIFNQAIPAWLITIAMYLQRNNKNIVVLLALSVLQCTMPFVGLIPFAAYWMFCTFRKRGVREWIRDTFTFENIFGGGTIGITSAFYLLKSGGETSFLLFDFKNGGWFLGLLYVVIAIGATVVVTYPENKRNALFYLSIIAFTILDFIPMDAIGNFSLRATLPVYLLFYLFFVKTIDLVWKDNNKKRMVTISVVLFMQCVYTLSGFNMWIGKTEENYWKGNKQTLDAAPSEKVLSSETESTKTKGSVFFTYMAKDVEHLVFYLSE